MRTTRSKSKQQSLEDATKKQAANTNKRPPKKIAIPPIEKKKSEREAEEQSDKEMEQPADGKKVTKKNRIIPGTDNVMVQLTE